MNKTADLAYWITERYAMKVRKESGVKPTMKAGWSNDPNMGTVRYCNVHREDDKVTQWLAENWRPEHHSVWETVLARMVNYIPTLEEINTRVGWGDPGHYMKARRDRGEKVFTSAYTISTCGQSMDKIDYVMEVVGAVKYAEEEHWEQARTLATAHSQFQQVSGLGSFLAAQVVADLKNTVGHPLQVAPDWWSWSAPGPGSLKGLAEYFNIPSVTPGQYHRLIEQCADEVFPLIPKYIPPIHMQDFQNCLCEFSKYERIKRGGHARNRYSAG